MNLGIVTGEQVVGANKRTAGKHRLARVEDYLSFGVPYPGWPYRRPVARTHAEDGYPGALHVHQAADGALAWVRLPGGMVTAGQFAALVRASSRFGAGTLELTRMASGQMYPAVA